MLQKNKQLYILHKEGLYTCLFALVCSILFYLFFQFFSGYGTFSYLICLKLSDKVVNILHSSSITFVGIFFLTSYISKASFSFLINISRGYLIYDIVVMIIFGDMHAIGQAAFSKWLKLSVLIVHHFIFLWTTYQIDRYPKLLAQGLIAESCKLPFYSWWAVRKFAVDFVILGKLLMVASLITTLTAKVGNFAMINVTLWHDKKVTRLEFLWIFLLFLFSCCLFAKICYDCEPVL